MDQHTGDKDTQPTDQNDGQLPGRDDAQLPQHNEAEYLDPTLRQSNFVTTANLSGTPGGARFQIDDNTTWASTSLRNEYDLQAYDDHDARLPQEQFDPTYHGGPVLNYDQIQQWHPNAQPNSWGMSPTATQSFFGNDVYHPVDQQQTQYSDGHLQGYTGGYYQVPSSQGNNVYQTSDQQQTQAPGGYYPGLSGSYNQAPPTSNYNYDHLGHSNLHRYNNPFQQEAYPGHRPTFTTPHTPATNGSSFPAAYDQQRVLTSTESARTEPVSTNPASTEPASAEVNKKSRQRKRERPDNQQEGDEEEDEQKDATKKSKGDTSVETKKRKKQDEEDRRALSRMRDEAASRSFDMASQHFPDAAARAVFQEQWDLVMRLNREIDGNTELYLPWYSTRASLRKTDRAVPERKKEG